MIRYFTLLVTCFVMLSNVTAQRENATNFVQRFAFRHSDSVRAVLSTNSTNNTNAMIYNPVANEFWAGSSHNDSMLRFSLRGNYLGRFKINDMTNGTTSKYLRHMTVKDNSSIWAVNGTDSVRKMDIVTGQVVARFKVPASMGTQTMIAYDSVSKGFWIGGLAYRFRLMDSTFTNSLDSLIFTGSEFPNAGAPTAMFHDSWSPGGPFIWFMTSKNPEFPNLGTSGSTYTAMQVSVATKKRTGIQKCAADDFDFIINVNQFGRALFMTRLPGYANPVMVHHMGKFTSGTSSLLATDLSGVTVGYEIFPTWKQDASIDSMAISGYSMIPTAFAKPVTVTVKTRNVITDSTLNLPASGNIRYETRNNGSIINTQSVPYNLATAAITRYTTPATVTLQPGINKITANLVQPNDPVKRNDTLSGYVALTDTTLARDYVNFISTQPIVSNSTCFCASATRVFVEKPEVGARYQLDKPVTITSVTAKIGPYRSGDTTRMKVYTINAQGKPIYAGQTNLTFITPADSAAQTLTLSLQTPVTIAANQEFMVSITEGFNAPYVLSTTQGYQYGKTMAYAIESLGGWQLADTLTVNFLRASFMRAVAIRPNFRIRTDNEELNAVSSFQVSPNPTNGLVNVEIQLEKNTDATLRVYSLNGQTVQQQRMEAVKTINTQVDLSSFANGIYLISVTTPNGVVTRKVVKQ